jgi:hypothetical protein
LNAVNNEYFDLQEKEGICIEIAVTEEENRLLAHRGRRGEEECWSNYRPCRGASEPAAKRKDT